MADQPKLYPAVDYIRIGYRRSVYKADSIYYRIANDGIVEIITILGRQDEIGVFEELP
jgi:toxin ParE1/3/4